MDGARICLDQPDLSAGFISRKVNELLSHEPWPVTMSYVSAGSATVLNSPKFSKCLHKGISTVIITGRARLFRTNPKPLTALIGSLDLRVAHLV